MYIEGAIKGNGYYTCASVCSYIAGRNSCRPAMYVGVFVLMLYVIVNIVNFQSYLDIFLSPLVEHVLCLAQGHITLQEFSLCSHTNYGLFEILVYHVYVE